MGTEREATVELSPIQLGRTLHIQRLFANRYSLESREPYLSVEAVRKALQKTLGVELRHGDIKSCVRVLAQKGYLEEALVGDSTAYRISPVGLDSWLKGRSLYSMMM